MRKYLANILGFLSLCIERFKGTRTIEEIKGPNNALGNLQCHAECDYQLTIFCQRKDYLVKYDKWYIPDHIVQTYRVSSETTGSAPCVLREACELDVDFPAFVSKAAPEKFIAKTMINAYLDLLASRLGNKTCAT